MKSESNQEEEEMDEVAIFDVEEDENEAIATLQVNSESISLTP